MKLHADFTAASLWNRAVCALVKAPAKDLKQVVTWTVGLNTSNLLSTAVFSTLHYG